jgi:spore coat protein A
MHMAGMQMPAAPTPNPPRIGPPMLHTLALAPFVDALPLPETIRPTLQNGHRSLTLTMQEIHAKVHRDVPPTRLWSYGPNPLAPLIEARSGEPLQIRWVNNLPTKHFLPIDHSLHGGGHDVPDVRTTTHLHGAKTASKDDGYPEDWFIPGQSRICTYPLQQDATALWYHDHAMGLTRLNTYAGLFGMFLLRDHVEDALPLPRGKYEVPLILYDRDFATDGQIFYDVSGDPKSPWIPEFSADGILINGKIRPYFEVEPRLCDASQHRQRHFFLSPRTTSR